MIHKGDGGRIKMIKKSDYCRIDASIMIKKGGGYRSYTSL